MVIARVSAKPIFLSMLHMAIHLLSCASLNWNWHVLHAYIHLRAHPLLILPFAPSSFTYLE
jgi:hypothetical protein